VGEVWRNKMKGIWNGLTSKNGIYKERKKSGEGKKIG
jgi:hypothetical protein